MYFIICISKSMSGLNCIMGPAVLSVATKNHSTAEFSSQRLDYILMQRINQRQLISYSNEMLIILTTSAPWDCRVLFCLSGCLSSLLLSLSINDCLAPLFVFQLLSPFSLFSFLLISLFAIQTTAPQALPSASQSFNFLPW